MTRGSHSLGVHGLYGQALKLHSSVDPEQESKVPQGWNQAVREAGRGRQLDGQEAGPGEGCGGR